MTEQTHQPQKDNKTRTDRRSESVEWEEQIDLNSDLALASKTPTAQTLTPNVVMQLQRTYGNRFARDLVMRSKSEAIAVTPAPSLPLSGGRIQRELATPLPEETPEAQEDLTEREIRLAIVHNGHRYSEEHTRTIQDIIGTEQTGRFAREDILAIARIQEEYGLGKDGLIGPEMFRFLNEEMDREGVDVSDENCLVSFTVLGPDEVQGGRVVNADGTRDVRIRGHFRIRVQFQTRCKPEDFQYRQFIQGTATATRGATVQNVANFWRNIPGGRLPSSFSEDGNTTWTAPNYGHRDQPGQATTTTTQAENHYVNEDGSENQASGSIYKAEDFPEATIRGLQAGDVLNVQINFRGEVHRNGRVVQTRRWTAVNLQNFVLA